MNPQLPCAQQQHKSTSANEHAMTSVGNQQQKLTSANEQALTSVGIKPAAQINLC